MGDLIDMRQWPGWKERRRDVTDVTDVTETDSDIDVVLGDVTPIRRLQPGDVLDVVIKLRQLMSQCETCAFTLYASFEDLGGEVLDKEAEKARHTLELATHRMASLLASIEKTDAYQTMRRETLNRRRDRSGRSTGRGE